MIEVSLTVQLLQITTFYTEDVQRTETTYNNNLNKDEPLFSVNKKQKLIRKSKRYVIKKSFPRTDYSSP